MYKIKSREQSDLETKLNVYFCGYEKNTPEYFEQISDELLEAADCNIWYYKNEDCAETKNYLDTLIQMELFIIPLTKEFLYENLHVLKRELLFAVEHNINIWVLVTDDEVRRDFEAMCREWKLGELTKGWIWFNEARRTEHFKLAMSLIYMWAGRLKAYSGEFALADVWFEHALDVANKIKSKAGKKNLRADILWCVGEIKEMLGDGSLPFIDYFFDEKPDERQRMDLKCEILKDAIKDLKEAKRLKKEFTHNDDEEELAREISRCYNLLGTLEEKMDNPAAAQLCYILAKIVLEETEFERKQLEQNEIYYERAVKQISNFEEVIKGKVKSKTYLRMIYKELGRIYKEEAGDLDSFIVEEIDVYIENSERREKLFELRENLEKAVLYYEKTLAIKSQFIELDISEMETELIYMCELLGRIETLRGDAEKAREYYDIIFKYMDE